MPMKNQSSSEKDSSELLTSAELEQCQLTAHRPVVCLGWFNYRHPIYSKEPPLETSWKDSYGLLGSITFTHTFETNSICLKFVKNKKRIGAPPPFSWRMFWQCPQLCEHLRIGTAEKSEVRVTCTFTRVLHSVLLGPFPRTEHSPLPCHLLCTLPAQHEANFQK